jgi:hypothetical protein
VAFTAMVTEEVGQDVTYIDSCAMLLAEIRGYLNPRAGSRGLFFLAGNTAGDSLPLSPRRLFLYPNWQCRLGA